MAELLTPNENTPLDTPAARRAASRFRAAHLLAIAFMLVLVIELPARGAEALSRHLPGEPIRQRAAILREQSQEIAVMLDTTRHVRDVLDSLLGWTYKPGYATEHDHLNRQGLRALHEYATVARRGVFRVAAFGDSFVYGNEVGDGDAWCALLEASTDDLEVFNYGVGGYGLDQAFLRFEREGMTFRPDVVLIIFDPDDLRRIVNVYRRFISTQEWPLSKPRFQLKADGGLALVPNPLARREDFVRLMQHPEAVRSMGALDAWYPRAIYENPLYDHVAAVRVGTTLWRWLDRRFIDPDRLIRDGVFNARSSAFALQVAVLDSFAKAVRAAGPIPVVVLLPDPQSLASVRSGGVAVYAPLRDSLTRRGLTVWDAVDAFPSARSIGSLYAPYLHYSPLGNKLLAGWLGQQLEPLRMVRSASSHAAGPGAGVRPSGE